MRRRVLTVLAVVFSAGAVVLAVLPYTGRSTIEVPAKSNEPPDADGNFLNLTQLIAAEGRCQPPVISAWRKDGSKDEGFWAVTEGTNKMAYAKLTSMGSLCAPSARRRLLGALGLGVLGAGTVLIRRRSNHPSAVPSPADR